MKLPKVEMEDFIILAINHYLVQLEPKGRAWLISGDPIENFLPKPNSLTLDLRIDHREHFKINFEGNEELMTILRTEEHVNQYMPFFHNTKNAYDTIIRDRDGITASQGVQFHIKVHFNDSPYNIYVTLFNIQQEVR